MAERVLNRASVRLDSPVSKIERVGNASERKHRGWLRNHKDFHVADAVILTIPLGCLQKRAVQFEPHLPLPIYQSIDHLGYG